MKNLKEIIIYFLKHISFFGLSFIGAILNLFVTELNNTRVQLRTQWRMRQIDIVCLADDYIAMIHF
jgi:hypothetical protein